MADMVKRKNFLENEVVDLTEEIKLVSPTDTPLTNLDGVLDVADTTLNGVSSNLTVKTEQLPVLGEVTNG